MRFNEVINVSEYESVYVPQGVYYVMISAENITNSQYGTHCEFTYQILDGNLKGCHFKDRLPVANCDERQLKAGRYELSRIASAIGIKHIQDTAELFYKPFEVEISYKEINGKEYMQKRNHKPVSAEFAQQLMKDFGQQQQAGYEQQSNYAQPYAQQSNYAESPF